MTQVGNFLVLRNSVKPGPSPQVHLANAMGLADLLLRALRPKGKVSQAETGFAREVAFRRVSKARQIPEFRELGGLVDSV